MDPKSIVCEHFRAGQCTKGHKCKYSHDLNVERKTAKAALYDEDEGKEVHGTLIPTLAVALTLTPTLNPDPDPNPNPHPNPNPNPNLNPNPNPKSKSSLNPTDSKRCVRDIWLKSAAKPSRAGCSGG